MAREKYDRSGLTRTPVYIYIGFMGPTDGFFQRSREHLHAIRLNDNFENWRFFFKIILTRHDSAIFVHYYWPSGIRFRRTVRFRVIYVRAVVNLINVN